MVWFEPERAIVNSWLAKTHPEWMLSSSDKNPVQLFDLGNREACAWLSKYIGERAKKVGGHGGMDFIMDYRLAYCLQNGLPLDMDVYDLAEWCCMAELTRLSIENNSAPVEVPDFTRGGWNKVQGYRHAFAK